MKFDEIVEEVTQALEPPMDEIPAWCPNEDCNWKGKLGDCGSEWDSEGWEYPSYQVAVCPKCGEQVEY